MKRIIMHLFAFLLLGVAVFHLARFIILNDINLIQIQVIDFEWVNALYICLATIAAAFITFVFFISFNPLNKIWFYVVYPIMMFVLIAFVFYQIPYVNSFN
ncbi:hypothetical protein [Marinicellulosiphila megalodicopiae]|uniref:hypothetical protein n=1 Tax=Marinicellulosiphila megalodicopiae TaxID=2724896 RepID=UPI003BAF72AE